MSHPSGDPLRLSPRGASLLLETEKEIDMPHPRMLPLGLGLLLWAGVALPARPAWAACSAPGCTKIIDNGPDAGKRVVVIMGDGFAAGDQSEFNDLVED